MQNEAEYGKTYPSIQSWFEKNTTMKWHVVYQSHFVGGYKKYLGIEKYLGRILDKEGTTDRLFVHDEKGLYDFLKKIKPERMK